MQCTQCSFRFFDHLEALGHNIIKLLPHKVYMAYVLANFSLCIHPDVVEQHYYLFRAMF